MSHLVLGGEEVERMGSLKYLGTIMNSTFSFNGNAQNINKNGNKVHSLLACFIDVLSVRIKRECSVHDGSQALKTPHSLYLFTTQD